MNAFTEGNEEPGSPTLADRSRGRGGPAQATGRGPPPVGQAAVDGALARVAADAAVAERNLMPAIFDAVRAYATVGEIVGALAGVFGRWRPR